MSLLDLAELTDAEKSGDALVVGSGPAGIAVAKRLEQAGRRVIVLESGNADSFEAHWNIPRAAFAAAEYGGEYTQVHVRRQLGGGSAVWGGWCAIPRSITFEERELGPSYGWPIKRKDLVDYYGMAAAYLKLDYLPEDFAPQQPLASAAGVVPERFHFSPPVRIYDDFYEELTDSHLITVVQNSTVDSLIEGPSEGRIGGCLAVGQSGSTHRFIAPIVILCAGAVGNARLITRLSPRSGIHIQAHANAGRWLQEHPHKYSMFQCILRPEIAQEVTSRGLINNRGFVSLAPNETLVSAKRWADFNFQLAPRSKDLSPSMTALAESYSAIYSQTPIVFDVTLGMEQLPDIKNSVLSPSTLALGLDGEICLDFGLRQEDAAEEALAWFVDNVAHSISLPEVPSPTVAVGHLHGTTRMAASSEWGVVDRHTRVFGLDNLYVGGSSVMPTNGFANPTFTICALAFRTADIILGEATTQ